MIEARPTELKHERENHLEGNGNVGVKTGRVVTYGRSRVDTGESLFFVRALNDDRKRYGRSCVFGFDLIARDYPELCSKWELWREQGSQ